MNTNSDPRWKLVPFEGPTSLSTTVESLLKHPGRLVHECFQGNKRAIVLLFVLSLLCMAGFGLLLGSFSGGMQWWAAPAKVACGALISAALCLPSLYIFMALNGADIRLAQVLTLLLASLGLTGLLLVGFAPVLWVFSQSSDSLGFMGFLAIAFWLISLALGLRLLSGAAASISPGSASGYLLLWMFIFVIVTLQMSTTLRPILGKADTLLPAQKRFFMAHWLDSFDTEPEHPKSRSSSAGSNNRD